MRKGWQTVKLGEVANTYSGGTPLTSNASYYGNDIPWLNTKEINFSCIYDTEKKITPMGLESSSAKWVPANSVIIAMYGATAGKSAINKIPLTTNQACCNIIPLQDKLHYYYLYSYLRLNYKDIESMATGSAQQNLNVGIIKNLDIPLPPLEEQERIASILSAFDDKIEVNNKICKDLEALAKLLFNKNFTTNPDKDSWPVAKLGEVAEFVKGKKPEIISATCEDDFLPYLTISVLERNEFLYANTKQSIICSEDNLIMVMDGASSGRVYFGLNGIVASTCSKIQTSIDINLLYCILKYNESFIMSHLTGSAIPHTDKKLVLNIEFPLPPAELLAEFEAVVAPLFAQIKNLQQQNASLASTRDLLLPRLMKGEV